MNTENLSTLKIHKLTKAQYDRELAAGRIDENALYLTPDEEIDLSPYATVEQLNTKADAGHIHDDRYYTETEIDAKFATINVPVDSVNGKTGNIVLVASDVGAPTLTEMETAIASIPNPDMTQYYTKTEVDAAIAAAIEVAFANIARAEGAEF